MTFLRTSWQYTNWSLEFLVYPPFCFVTLALVVSTVVSILRQRPFAHESWKKSYWIVLAQFLFFPATIAVGVYGRVDWQRPHFPGPNRAGLWAENCFLFGSLMIGMYLVWRMKGIRWYATNVLLVQLWLLAAAGFIAAMSLTGTWL